MSLLKSVLGAGETELRQKVAQFIALPQTFRAYRDRLQRLQRVQLPPAAVGRIEAALEVLSQMESEHARLDARVRALTATGGARLSTADTVGVAVSAASLIGPVNNVFARTASIGREITSLEQTAQGMGVSVVGGTIGFGTVLLLGSAVILFTRRKFFGR